MAATGSQKDLLSLIRGFASEKSHGERKILGLNKRIQELRSELDSATGELEDAKRRREICEQELRGCEFELTMSDASIQSLEARISVIQDEVSVAGSDLEAIKQKEGNLRDEFIRSMFELNANIRKFQEQVTCALSEDNSTITAMDDDMEERSDLNAKRSQELACAEEVEARRRILENEIAEIVSQTNAAEQEFQAEQDIHNQVQNHLKELERKLFLMEGIMKESMDLQNLTKQSAELEQKCAFLGEELQSRFTCPRCHRDNVNELEGALQTCNE